MRVKVVANRDGQWRRFNANAELPDEDGDIRVRRDYDGEVGWYRLFELEPLDDHAAAVLSALALRDP